MTTTVSRLEARLAAVRAELEAAGVQAMIVPRADRHQNEYVAPSDERLRFISGFSGTAGIAVITGTEAALFTDGRYTIQAERQLPSGSWEICPVAGDGVTDWLGSRLGKGDRVGFDPELYPAGKIGALNEKLARYGIETAPLDPNPIDTVWQDRPAPPAGPVELYPVAFAGEAAKDKRARVAAALRQAGCAGLLISAPDSLAWVLNIRGSDLDMVPVVFGFGLVAADGATTFFVDEAKLDEPTRTALVGDGGLKIAAPDALAGALAAFKGRRLRLDVVTASVRLVQLAESAGVEVDLGPDPIAAMKAAKNVTEVDGMRASHLRDATAVLRFLRWFASERPDGATEWDLVKTLAGFRETLQHYQGPSFPTISASAENAALAHYQVSEGSARTLGKDEIYLVDSGGQYLDGTTDITRVAVTGQPSDEMRLRYTQVLKGHVALCRQRFPRGVSGAQLDGLSRQFLWGDGVDFDHGTGHGVGHYLSVHEGPQSISQRGAGVPLVPGMVVSIEPGYYKIGAFGIRIENLAVVRTVADPPPLADRELLEFEMLTMVPYERALISLPHLTEEEIAWVDAYHAQVAEALAPQLSGADLDYLKTATAPLGN